MSQPNKATPPGILKKSTSASFTVEEKVRNLEKKLEDYVSRMNSVEDTLARMYEDESTEEYYSDVDHPRNDSVKNHGTFTISWMPDNPPRVTQRDREIAIWRSWNKTDLCCDEKIKDL